MNTKSGHFNPSTSSYQSKRSQRNKDVAVPGKMPEKDSTQKGQTENYEEKGCRIRGTQDRGGRRKKQKGTEGKQERKPKSHHYHQTYDGDQTLINPALSKHVEIATIQEELQPLPTHSVHKGWGATDRVRKMGSLAYLASPKKWCAPCYIQAHLFQPKTKAKSVRPKDRSWISWKAHIRQIRLNFANKESRIIPYNFLSCESN